MKITPIVIKAFREWLKRTAKGDLSALGIDINNDESIKNFLKEVCYDLTYNECKAKVLENYPTLFTVKRTEYEEEALRAMNYYLGTSYVSEAFKKVFTKYRNMFYDGSILEKWDTTELSLIYDVLNARYNCIDYDIRRLYDLGFLGFRIHDLRLETNIERAFYQFATYLGFKPSRDRYEFITLFKNLGVAGYRDDFYLVCVIEYGVEEEDSKGTVITTTGKPFIIFNMKRKTALILR